MSPGYPLQVRPFQPPPHFGLSTPIPGRVPSNKFSSVMTMKKHSDVEHKTIATGFSPRINKNVKSSRAIAKINLERTRNWRDVTALNSMHSNCAMKSLRTETICNWHKETEYHNNLGLKPEATSLRCSTSRHPVVCVLTNHQSFPGFVSSQTTNQIIGSSWQ